MTYGPRVSILTPALPDREWFLWRCKSSVRAQTHQGPIEHIVEPTLGRPPAETFQACLNQARGDYVMPLADDDWLAPHAVETLVGLLGEGADFASGRTLIVTRARANTTNPENVKAVGEKLDPGRIAQDGFTLGGAHMWRKTLTDQHGGFNPQHSNAADYELYWRLAKTGCQVAFTPEILYFYTDHPDTDGNLNGALIAKQCAAIRDLHL